MRHTIRSWDRIAFALGIGLVGFTLLTGCTRVERRSLLLPVPYETCRETIYESFGSDNRRTIAERGTSRAPYVHYNEAIEIVEKDARTKCIATYRLVLPLGRRIATLPLSVLYHLDDRLRIIAEISPADETHMWLKVADRRNSRRYRGPWEPEIIAAICGHVGIPASDVRQYYVEE